MHGMSQLAGPMWSGSLHDKEFIAKVLEHIASNEDRYGTAKRMKGMLTIAKEVRHAAMRRLSNVVDFDFQELDVPFFFMPDTLSGCFHCISPSLHDFS